MGINSNNWIVWFVLERWIWCFRFINEVRILIVKARLNWGRWICDCPTENCNNAEYAIWNQVNRKEMICAVCGNGIWKISIPRHKKQIEQAVSSRPVENQNWEQGESIRFLQLENIKYEVK